MTSETVTLITNALPAVGALVLMALNHLHVRNAAKIVTAANQAALDGVAAAHGNFLDALPTLIRDAQAIDEAATAAPTSAAPVAGVK